MAVRLSVLHASHPLPPGRFLVLTSVRGCVNPRAIVQLKELGQLKTPMISLGIKPTTFWLVAYAIENHLCPKQSKYGQYYKIWKRNFVIIYSAAMSVQSPAL
jgi:hypothetical protein